MTDNTEQTITQPHPTGDVMAHALIERRVYTDLPRENQLTPEQADEMLGKERKVLVVVGLGDDRSTLYTLGEGAYLDDRFNVFDLPDCEKDERCSRIAMHRRDYFYRIVNDTQKLIKHNEDLMQSGGEPDTPLLRHMLAAMGQGVRQRYVSMLDRMRDVPAIRMKADGKLLFPWECTFIPYSDAAELHQLIGENLTGMRIVECNNTNEARDIILSIMQNVEDYFKRRQRNGIFLDGQQILTPMIHVTNDMIAAIPKPGQKEVPPDKLHPTIQRWREALVKAVKTVVMFAQDENCLTGDLTPSTEDKLREAGAALIYVLDTLSEMTVIRKTLKTAMAQMLWRQEQATRMIEVIAKELQGGDEQAGTEEAKTLIDKLVQLQGRINTVLPRPFHSRNCTIQMLMNDDIPERVLRSAEAEGMKTSPDSAIGFAFHVDIEAEVMSVLQTLHNMLETMFYERFNDAQLAEAMTADFPPKPTVCPVHGVTHPTVKHTTGEGKLDCEQTGELTDEELDEMVRMTTDVVQ